MNRLSLFSSLRFLMCVVLLSIGSVCFAQPGDPGDDPDIPVDGGVAMLVAAGAGYGIKRYRDSRQKKAN